MTIIKKAAGLLGFTAALAVAMPLAMAEGDAAAGEKVFKKCKACHVVDKKKNRLGPHLIGVFGRTSGTVEGFEKKYSKAMKEAAIVWDEATLDEYLPILKPIFRRTRWRSKAFPRRKTAPT